MACVKLSGINSECFKRYGPLLSFPDMTQEDLKASSSGQPKKTDLDQIESLSLSYKWPCVSQGPHRKLVTYSIWSIWGGLIKRTIYKGPCRGQIMQYPRLGQQRVISTPRPGGASGRSGCQKPERKGHLIGAMTFSFRCQMWSSGTKPCRDE